MLAERHLHISATDDTSNDSTASDRSDARAVCLYSLTMSPATTSATNDASIRCFRSEDFDLCAALTAAAHPPAAVAASLREAAACRGEGVYPAVRSVSLEVLQVPEVSTMRASRCSGAMQTGCV